MQSTTVTEHDGELPAVGNDALEILMNDHRTVRGLLERLTSGELAGRAMALKQLKAALTIHNATEENLVYPAIAELAGRPMHAGRLYHQQDEAKTIVWQLGMLDPGNPGFEAKARELRAAIEAHVTQEEEHEFVHLRDDAREALGRLTKDVLEFRHSLRFVEHA